MIGAYRMKVKVQERVQEKIDAQKSELGARQAQVAAIQHAAETWTPQRTLAWAFETFGDFVAISSAFGSQGVAVIDMASRLRKNLRVFTLDTEFLFPETYDLMDKIEEKYEIRIEKVYSSLSPSVQEQVHGTALWSRTPDLCCNLRKVEPLRRKLGTLDAWITSIRRNQTPSRAGARRIEWDAKFGLVKINPIVDWTEKQVWRYIFDHGVPYNQLHDHGFPSIGCTHCTRAVLPGELPRDGRWPGFAKTECGLHIIEPSPTVAETEIANAAEAGS
jgi:phosphoadenosine phosphosulfate reductase